ncbi:hypothetical protein ABW21_db0202600 [Orbilia brochopaga]|nr:hypothetical protein ABW21_db0202600 [Drechslerella brochopaga]
MLNIHCILLGVVALKGAASMAVMDDEWHLRLLKRQAPGTPAYNCHDNCGQAITASRKDGHCQNDAFLTDYANCLQCSGPDNQDIWKYYSFTLTGAGSECGLSTTPLSGPQPDVGPAVSAGGQIPSGVQGSTTTAPATSVGLTTREEPEPEPTQSSTEAQSATSTKPPVETTTTTVPPAPTVTTAITSETAAATTTTAVPATEYPTYIAPATSSTSKPVVITPTYGAGNGTTTTIPTPPSYTGGANSNFVFANGFFIFISAASAVLLS